jgi:hypothetical protein
MEFDSWQEQTFFVCRRVQIDCYYIRDFREQISNSSIKGAKKATQMLFLKGRLIKCNTRN